MLNLRLDKSSVLSWEQLTWTLWIWNTISNWNLADITNLIKRYTSLLLHWNGDWSFIDSSINPKSISVIGSATQSSAQSKFWWKSMYFNGSSYLVIPDSDDWNFGNEDFTIDFWIKTSWGSWCTILTQSSIWSETNRAWGFGFDGDAARFWFYVTNDNLGNSWTWTLSSTAINDNIWHHIAAVRYWTSLKIYKDGVVNWNLTLPVGYTINNSSRSLGIAAIADGRYALAWYYDELRIVKGLALWTSNFTPPTTEY